MGVFKQMGALASKMKMPKLDVSARINEAILKPMVTEAEKLDKYQNDAYSEMDKNILAPVIKEDKANTLTDVSTLSLLLLS